MHRARNKGGISEKFLLPDTFPRAEHHLLSKNFRTREGPSLPFHRLCDATTAHRYLSSARYHGVVVVIIIINTQPTKINARKIINLPARGQLSKGVIPRIGYRRRVRKKLK